MATVELLLLILVSVVVFSILKHESLRLGLERVDGFAALAVITYLTSHAVRILRMVVVLGTTIRSVRGVALAHSLTAPIATVVPLKLGELVRIYAFGKVTGGGISGLGAVWVERTFDAATLTTVGLIALFIVPETTPVVLPVLSVAGAFLVITITMLVVLPQNIGLLKDFFIRRYSGWWCIRLLKVLDRLGVEVRRIHALVRGKVSTLAALTLAVWCLEALTLWTLMEFLALSPGELMASLLAVLSEVLAHLRVGPGELDWQMPVYRLIVLCCTLTLAFAALGGELLLWRDQGA